MKKIQINNFKENLYYEKLKNGLEIYIVPIKNKKSFAGMIATKYGGRSTSFKIGDKEYSTPTGIAHFLEHKMFEREEDPFEYYGRFGTEVNAATSEEYTCYYFIGSKYFKKSLTYLLNWIQSININEEQVEKERGIILEEASMYKDNPNRVMYNKIKENIYVNDTKKYKVIGTDSDIKRITKEQLELCYNSFYVPNNMYLIVTGNVNPNAVVQIVEQNTKCFKPIKSIGIMTQQKEPNRVQKKYEEIHMKVGIPKVSLSYKINKDCFKNINITDYELDLYLHSLLDIGLGSTSIIRQNWLEKGLFVDSFYRISEIESHYVIELHANSEKPDELIKELTNYIKNITIDNESFKREKKIWIANEIKAIEDPIATLYNVLDDLLDYKMFIQNKVEYIKNLNIERLLKIKQSIDWNNSTTIKILPIENTDKI